ncbi:MAG: APC family permease [Deltaproteobacteria bacterium]|nr:APC family permease [Deltaproteobacteria bacterium]
MVTQENSSRRLGIPSASALVIANMVGAGVFTTSGFALADLGSREYVLLAWLIGGLIALCGALSYGGLARRFPESGGEYLFLSRMVHPLAGFLAGWVSLLAGFTAPIAAAALGLQAYIGHTFGPDIRPEWIGTLAIAAAGVIHGFRFREGVWLQNAAVALKLLLIFGFIAFGLSTLPERASTTAPSVDFVWGAFAVTLVWISFSYSGWNAVVYIAGEVRDPERSLHRSLLLGTSVVMVMYLGLNAVFLYSVPMEDLAGKVQVGAIAAHALGGARLEQGVSLLVGLALFTSIWSMVMVGPRVYAKMAEDGLFPHFLKPDGDVPTAAIALQSGAAIVVVWLTGLAELLSYIGFTLGISAALTVLALIFLRVREGKERVRVPGFPFVPIAFVVATLWAAGFMALREPTQAAAGLATALLGIPVYLWIRRRP